MSGWFGTSNGEVNDPFHGIEAGYRGRRNHQLGRIQRERQSGRSSRGPVQSKPASKPAVQTTYPKGSSGQIMKQEYKGYTLTTKQVKGGWQTSTSGRAGKKSHSGASKGQSINNAKNYVDQQTMIQVSSKEPAVKQAVKNAETKSKAYAAKIAKQDTAQAVQTANQVKTQAKRVIEQTKKDPSLTKEQKIAKFQQASRAAEAADAQKRAAQASEVERFNQAYQAKMQSEVNQAMQNKTLFTEASAQSVVKAMTPQTSGEQVAQQNRELELFKAAAAFRPVTMPNDFIAGSYTVRGAYNPTLKNYVVTVFQGTVNKEKKTFGQNEGEAAVSKFNEFKRLATMKAKYDAQESKIFTKGPSKVELVVTKSATLSGFLDGILGLFGIGGRTSRVDRMNRERYEAAMEAQKERTRRPIYTGQTPPSPTGSRPIYTGQNPKSGQSGPSPSPMSRPVPSGPDASILNRIADKERQIAKQSQERSTAVPQNIKSRTQAFDRKIKEFDQVVSEPVVSKPSVVASWSSMPTKSFAVQVNNGPSTPYATYEAAVQAYNAAVKTAETTPIVDASIQKRIDEARSQDGSGGAMTDPAAQIAPAPIVPAPAPIIPAAVIEQKIFEEVAPAPVVTASENYNDMVDASPAPVEILPQETKMIIDDEPPGAIVLPQPVTTYQTQTLPNNEWVVQQQAQRETAVAIDNNNSTLLLGAAALAGAVYLARK